MGPQIQGATGSKHPVNTSTHGIPAFVIFVLGGGEGGRGEQAHNLALA